MSKHTEMQEKVEEVAAMLAEEIGKLGYSIEVTKRETHTSITSPEAKGVTMAVYPQRTKAHNYRSGSLTGKVEVSVSGTRPEDSRRFYPAKWTPKHRAIQYFAEVAGYVEARRRRITAKVERREDAKKAIIRIADENGIPMNEWERSQGMRAKTNTGGGAHISVERSDAGTITLRMQVSADPKNTANLEAILQKLMSM